MASAGENFGPRAIYSDISLENSVPNCSSPHESRPELAHPSNWSAPAGRNSTRDILPSYRIAKNPQGLLFGWRLILMGSWINILMVFIPLSCIMDITHSKSRGLVFIFSVLSLVPLVKLHDVSTRELAIRIGGSKTGLVNASMSNIVEIVVAISALRKCELRVVQSSLIGSMLSKLLLVLGLCLFAGGVRFSEQGFDATATQLHSSLLSLSVGAVLLPAAYHFSLSGNSNIASELQMQNILKMSHGVAILLLFIYGSYLFFQLYSHTHLYSDGNKNRASQQSVSQEVFHRGYAAGEFTPSNAHRTSSPIRLSPPRNTYPASRSPYSISEATLTVPEQHPKGESDFSYAGIPMFRISSNESNHSAYLLEKAHVETTEHPLSDGSGARDERKPQLSLLLIVILLTVVTVAVAITADRLVESMDSISTTIRKEWVALILLPAVSSIAECMTAMNVSVKDQLDFAISVAVGSTIQTALFVIPFMVSLAWTMGKPLALLFDPFESLVLYISVQVMTYVMADGKSNYLEGIVLLCLYIIIAVSFWFYPVWSLSSSLAVCKAT
ncbi:Sodium/calcium exchanger protein-domain-containing protein [Mycena rosella]|uniref:Sodium/calcium exchanger protein-domain-containing protein n=1 Tax=Mycena rosella TaxID=1033263 RepID=A0AAD7GXU7_MYCRO|nr:Sodium/calcium exchanger protein-domain-containing protein [Mycena rosella]